jgi:uncharacterized membrane protein/protein-disulfide isomerase
MFASLPVKLTLAIIAALAARLSLTLARHARSPEALSGCGSQDGCESVLSSRWSKIGTLPVSVLALVIYSLIFAAALLTIPAAVPPTWKKFAWMMEFVLCMASGGAALWYLMLQLLVLRAWCLYCTSVHLLGLALTIVLWSGTSIESLAMSEFFVPPLILALLASMSVAVLISAQLLVRPRQYAVSKSNCTGGSLDGNAELIENKSPLSNWAEMETPSPTDSRREVRLVGGRVVIQSGPWPVIGSIDALYVIACLFDFTCPSCRRVHRLLQEAVLRTQRQLAVLLIPVPQDSACNPTIQNEVVDRNACEYARLALAVWATDPLKYADLEKWLFTPDSLPSIELTMDYASRLLGWSDPNPILSSMDRLITNAVAIQSSGNIGKIPTIFLPRATITGEIPSVEELLKVLQKELSLITPAASE